MSLVTRRDAVDFSLKRIGTFARFAVLCVPLLLLVACDRPLRLQVVLEKNEEISKGTPVQVDSTKAGTVVAVGDEGGERVADIAITLKEARERLRVGAVRVVEPGRIQINTDTVKDGATSLPRGARIPTTSKVGYWVTKYSQTSSIVVVAMAVALLLVVWLVFRSLVGTIGLVLCVMLSGVVTQVIHPYVVPWVEKGLNKIGPPPASAPVKPSVESKPAVEVTTETGIPSSAHVYQQAESTVIEVMNARPSPTVFTWCLVFVALFIGFNVVLGRVSRVWRK